ncbi:MAG: hypothetical protein V3U76_09640 [Granulosicoccus sp.]
MGCFPDEVVVALHNGGVTVTCVPVQIDGEDWKAALFYVMAADSPSLLDGGPFAVSLELDLHEHDNGTLVELVFEIDTPNAPLQGTVMFLTGHSSTHYDTMKLLASQTDLPLFIGNEYCQILTQQRIPLNDTYRSGFRQLLEESVSRDALIRLSGRYDPDKVFVDVLGLSAD